MSLTMLTRLGQRTLRASWLKGTRSPSMISKPLIPVPVQLFSSPINLPQLHTSSILREQREQQFYSLKSARFGHFNKIFYADLKKNKEGHKFLKFTEKNNNLRSSILIDAGDVPNLLEALKNIATKKLTRDSIQCSYQDGKTIEMEMKSNARGEYITLTEVRSVRSGKVFIPLEAFDGILSSINQVCDDYTVD